MARKVLLVDDDVDLGALIADFLAQHDFVVDAFPDFRSAEQSLQALPGAALILDVMLPGEDGLSICRRLRAQGDTRPILMLTAKRQRVDRIVGLEVGADFYLPKPFDPRELLASLTAVLRRAAGFEIPREPLPATQVAVGHFLLDLDRHLLLKGKAPVAMPAAELELLRALAMHPHRQLSRDELSQLTRGCDADPLDRTIDILISRVRRVIEIEPGRPRYIQTVRGHGYIFVPDAI
jgi:two-component system phosphate regulon response regulator OmpR